MNHFLFVYGLLRYKVDHPMAAYLREKSRLVGEGFIYGSLYDAGSYPALLLSHKKGSTVTGDIFEITKSSSDILNQLDHFEQADPGSRYQLYRRQRTSAKSGNKEFEVWVYEYNRSVQGMKQIESGDYLDWLDKKTT